ncbi:MAG TPA: HAMP domain-containing sensor histidine kinase [Mycobacteriales bacterium]|nr:HAMP domain-containing sensor histidine kinase [Mycobacteriales bacterium]
MERGAYDDLPDGVVVAGADGRVEDLNPVAQALLGLTADAARGRALADVVPLQTPAGEQWWSCVAKAAALPGSKRQPERILTLPADAAAGRPTDVQLAVTAAWTHRDGVLARTVVSLRDTAARRRNERSSADLISTVAHELRSPLTSVKGFTATLLARWDRFPDDVKKQMLETVNADADRVTRLLSELLDVSRIDAGRLEMRKQVVDVPEAVRKAFAGRIAAGEAEERFVLHLDSLETAALPEMWVDPDKLDQIVGNLVENAVRHGDGTVHVTVTAGVDPAGAVITVADEGEGIPDEQLGRVFTKFWRGGRRGGGTGLGLYIVKGLAEAHGGSVAAGRSEVHGGAELTVVLPAGPPPYVAPDPGELASG